MGLISMARIESTPRVVLIVLKTSEENLFHKTGCIANALPNLSSEKRKALSATYGHSKHEENGIVFLLRPGPPPPPFLKNLVKGGTMHLKRKSTRRRPSAITLESGEVENEKAIGLSFTATMAFYERD